MRFVLVVFIQLCVVTARCAAGWVDHSSQSGIVATSVEHDPGHEDQSVIWVLLDDGQTWIVLPDGGWSDTGGELDPPVPVTDLRYRDPWWVVTVGGEVWRGLETKRSGQPRAGSDVDRPRITSGGTLNKDAPKPKRR